MSDLRSANFNSVCYVAAGDQGRWIGIEGAAAVAEQYLCYSARGYCSQEGGCESERGG